MCSGACLLACMPIAEKEKAPCRLGAGGRLLACAGHLGGRQRTRCVGVLGETRRGPHTALISRLPQMTQSSHRGTGMTNWES